MIVDDLLDLDARLHGYQLRAVEHLWSNPRAGLFLECGLGKSAVVLQALTPEHLPVLVVGPKRVVENVWPAEVAKWRPDLSISVAAGGPAKRRSVLDGKHDITALGVANLKDAKPRYKTIVFDELSLFKSRDSARWKLAKSLARFTEHVWGLTGTPTPNGLIDLWPELYLLDQGERLGKGKRYGEGIVRFRERWFYPEAITIGGAVTRWLPRKGAQEEIQDLISDICLSMRSEDYLELDPITYNPVTVPLPCPKVYEELKATLVAQLENGTVTAANAAVLGGKLSQVTAGFLYGEDGSVNRLHTAKIDAVTEIVEGTGSPVLVFHRFKAEREALLGALPGSRTIDEPGVIDAWNAGGVPVLIMHPASGGHGLNLAAGGHTIVWTTLDYSAELWAQANARLHRQGQTKPVIVHILECPGTIDSQVRSVVTGKIRLQDAVMAALTRCDDSG